MDEFQATPGKRLIAVVIGHTEKEPGAAFILDRRKYPQCPIRNEYEYNVALSYHIADALLGYYDVNIVFRDGLGLEKTYAELARNSLIAACIELHFNSHELSAIRGTEVLVSKENGLFGIIFQGELCSALNRDHNQDRGIKTLTDPTDRGYLSVNSLKVPSVLIEPFFGSNLNDSELGLNRMLEIAHAIKIALDKWFAIEDQI